MTKLAVEAEEDGVQHQTYIYWSIFTPLYPLLTIIQAF